MFIYLCTFSFSVYHVYYDFCCVNCKTVCLSLSIKDSDFDSITNSVVLLFLIGFYVGLHLGLGPCRFTIKNEGESWMY